MHYFPSSWLLEWSCHTASEESGICSEYKNTNRNWKTRTCITWAVSFNIFIREFTLLFLLVLLNTVHFTLVCVLLDFMLVQIEWSRSWYRVVENNPQPSWSEGSSSELCNGFSPSCSYSFSSFWISHCGLGKTTVAPTLDSRSSSHKHYNCTEWRVHLWEYCKLKQRCPFESSRIPLLAFKKGHPTVRGMYYFPSITVSCLFFCRGR